MISVAGVTKTYRSGRGLVHALTDVDLAVPAGGFAAVMGKSGSGKSTLLNCIGGLEIPDRGEIRCFDTRIDPLAARPLSLFQRRQVGFVFQRGNLLSYLTVADNIGLPLALNGIGGKERTRRIETLLAEIDLAGVARAMPHELSGGETQRVSVARAVAHRPRLLLADEPTGNLDRASGQEVIASIEDLNREGMTVVVVTHDPDLGRRTRRQVRMMDGRIEVDRQGPS